MEFEGSFARRKEGLGKLGKHKEETCACDKAGSDLDYMETAFLSSRSSPPRQEGLGSHRFVECDHVAILSDVVKGRA